MYAAALSNILFKRKDQNHLVTVLFDTKRDRNRFVVFCVLDIVSYHGGELCSDDWSKVEIGDLRRFVGRVY